MTRLRRGQSTLSDVPPHPRTPRQARHSDVAEVELGCQGPAPCPARPDRKRRLFTLADCGTISFLLARGPFCRKQDRTMLLQHIFALALQQVSQECFHNLVSLLRNHTTEEGKLLRRSLQESNEWAWKCVELALFGEGWW